MNPIKTKHTNDIKSSGCIEGGDEWSGWGKIPVVHVKSMQTQGHMMRNAPSFFVKV